jgi:hypothetical protein
MSLLQLSELSPNQIEQAYALVRLGSGWSEQEWQEHCCRLAEGKRGSLCVMAPSGVLLGLAAYSVVAVPTDHRVLKVSLFIAFELGIKGSVKAALTNGLAQLAGELGCSATYYAFGSRGLLKPRVEG